MGNGKKIRVLFAGGGTGGHVYPAVAMYESLKESGAGIEVLFVGARGGVEGRLLPALGLPLVLLPGRGLRGASLLNKLRWPFEFLSGVFQGVRTISAYKPDVVVGTGGYASVAIVVAAILCRKPRILQEQNSVPGLVNRRLARFADLILLSYEESRTALPAGVRAEVIGNPLRKVPVKDRAAGAEFLGLDPARFTVLVIGGSRGAHSLNVAGTAAAHKLRRERDMQFIFLTGDEDFEAVAGTFRADRNRITVRSYLHEVFHAYGAADVAIARSGASSVFELAAFGVPTIFVPYPYAADQHQMLNVNTLRKTGAAVVVPDAELTGGRLADEIEALMDAPGRRKEMVRLMFEWVKADAAQRAAERILELVKKKSDMRVKRTRRTAEGPSNKQRGLRGSEAAA